MKRNLLLFCGFLFYTTQTFSQNTGIGTSTPKDKLEVKQALHSTVRISSASFNDTSELLLSNRNASSQGTDFSIQSIGEDGLFISSRSDLPANNAVNLIVVSPTGNTGIGLIPVAGNKFSVAGTSSFNGAVKLEGLNLFEFGANVAGKEPNAGKIGYNAFGQNALTFVGAGTNASNRAVYFFAEGGTTTNGPLGFNGPLRINGNPGTNGQVLTSNGTSTAEWRNTAYANNTRFAASFTADFSFVPARETYTTLYNLTPADVTNNSTFITVNKTGLYHIEGFATYFANFSGAPTSLSSDFSLTVDGINLELATDEPLNNGGSFAYKKTFQFAKDIYITAPGNVGVNMSTGYVGPLTSRGGNGALTLYLISE